jgi:hypothetical protein
VHTADLSALAGFSSIPINLLITITGPNIHQEVMHQRFTSLDERTSLFLTCFHIGRGFQKNLSMRPPTCHPERSEGSHDWAEMLRCTQRDSPMHTSARWQGESVLACHLVYPWCVTLSKAKSLSRSTTRCFASLSMTELDLCVDEELSSVIERCLNAIS